MKARKVYSSGVIKLGEHLLPYILYNDASGLDDDELEFLDGFLSEVVLDFIAEHNLPCCEVLKLGFFEVGDTEHMTRCDLSGAIGDVVQVYFKVII